MSMTQIPENPVNDEHNEDEFIKELAKLININEIHVALGVPEHILATVMWNAAAQFAEGIEALNDHYDAINEQLLQEQMEND